MTTDTALLKLATQQYKLEFDLGSARYWLLSDVASDGSDDPAVHDYPPAADPDTPLPIVAGFDGITSVGTISGSIGQGGFTAELTIPKYPTNFDDYFQCSLYIRTWHGGIPGVVGAAGIDPGRIRLFKGYMQTVTSNRTFEAQTTRFPVSSSITFLKGANFRRSIEWGAGLPHGAPGDSDTIFNHLIDQHTNLTSRSQVGIYIPNHSLDRFTLNEGSLYDMLKALADNFTAGEGLVYCRREDDLFIGAHPNIIPDLHPNLNDPIIDLDDDLVLEWEVPETPPRQTASVQVIAQKSDGTEYSSPVFYQVGGYGDHYKPPRMYTDDTALVDTLAPRILAHRNRRYQNVKVTLPLNVAIDLGDVITCTTTLAQRGIVWTQQKFFVTAVEYQPVWDEQGNRTFKSVVTLDEIIV